MKEEPPTVPLHQRSAVQWAVIISIILAGIVGLLVWLQIDPKEFISKVSTFLDYCWKLRLYVGSAILCVIIFVRRRLLLRCSIQLLRRLLVGYARTLSFLLKPVFPKLATNQVQIHYGQLLVLQHFTTGKFLTSLDGRFYTHLNGSGQQIVFGASVPDQNSVWCIEGPHGTAMGAKGGIEPRTGDVVRVYHSASDQFLHSHPDESPSSTPGNIQREVSVSSQFNAQDNWTIRECEVWPPGLFLRLEHADGGQYLHSHDRIFDVVGRTSCLEVTCCSHRNEADFWILRPADLAGVELAPSRLNQGLVIYTATYGSGKKTHNVTRMLRGMAINNALSVLASQDRVGGQIVGDPCNGTPKILSVHYSINGERRHKASPEGANLNLP